MKRDQLRAVHPHARRPLHERHRPRRRAGATTGSTKTASSTCTRSSWPSRRRPSRARRISPVFDRTKMQMVPSTYDDMIPGCYDRDARVADFKLNWMDGSLPFPTFPRFCGQTFKEGNDLELGLACVRGVQQLDDRGVVRALGGREHPALSHPDLGRRARRRRGAAHRRPRACTRSASRRSRRSSGCPSIHTGDWDPLFAACNDLAVTLVHAHRFVVVDAGRVARRARGRRQHACSSTTRSRR